IFIPPPSSTLFPYTTLFRSEDLGLLELEQAAGRGQLRLDLEHLGRDAQEISHRPVRSRRRPATARVEAGDPGSRARTPRTPLRRDRKSTRLNSSHDQISYAV